MPAEPYGAAEIGARARVGPGGVVERVVGQERRQVRPHRHRADAGAAAAVGDAEGLVQVQVADVGAELAGLGHADQGVEVGAVEVHLAAVVVDQVADLADAGLEHAVGRGVGDHQAGEGRRAWSTTLDLRSSTSTLPSSSQATTTTRIPAMTAEAALVPWAEEGMRQTRRLGVAVGVVERADGQQAGQLALGAGVGLEAHGVVAGDLDEPRLELVDEGPVALAARRRHERVQVREAGPGDGLHLGGGVELHGAGAERDHRPVEGDVAVGEPPQVAQHLGLGPVRVEGRVGQELARPARRSSGTAASRSGSDSTSQRPRTRRPAPRGSRRRAGLVEGERHGVGVDEADVDPVRRRPLDDDGGLTRAPRR